MNKPPEKPPRKVLGKGLSALLPPRAAPQPAPEVVRDPAVQQNSVASIPVESIKANPYQPRSVFNASKIEELAASIRANGIIQPLIVRRKGSEYELVAGERRLRASQVAGLAEVPAFIQDYADEKMMEIALVENLQREDLNAIETAVALERLGKQLGLNHEEIGRRTGKDRTTVTNLIRLLRLPEEIQKLVAEQRLSMGHARVLAGIADAKRQLDLAHKAADGALSVRQIEKLAQTPTLDAEPKKAAQPAQDPNVADAVRKLETQLGTRVRLVSKTATTGRIEIEYYSTDELQRLYEILAGASEA